MRGGYQIIDFNNVEYKINTGMMYDGIYEMIESSVKPILLENIVLIDTLDDNKRYEFKPVYTIFMSKESNFEAKIVTSGKTFRITVTDTDVVTIGTSI